MLSVLGWVEVQGRRDRPRNSDCKIVSHERLLLAYETLSHARKDPARFLSLVFRSNDPVWLDRCSSIIQEKPGRQAAL